MSKLYRGIITVILNRKTKCNGCYCLSYDGKGDPYCKGFYGKPLLLKDDLYSVKRPKWCPLTEVDNEKKK